MNAANAYIDALAAHQVLERKQRTLAGAEQLVTATEQRLRAGDVSPAALWQVKVETERFRSEVFAAEGDVQVADYALELFLGPPRAGEPAHVQATGSLGIAARAFTAEELVAQALAVRSDLVVSLRAVDVARAQVDLAQANRWVDPSLNATLTEAPADPRAGAPASRTAGLSVSLPMPFSRRTHGELDAARAAVQKAETQAQAARRRVEIEVREALARYEATRRSVAVYTGEVLTNADRALEATRYSYERGAARLIELLDAQRTVDDVYLGYTGALADHAKALVALDRAAGRWEAPF
jgi:cobalt-zinc-cadmium efflux system outer membrane protein